MVKWLRALAVILLSSGISACAQSELDSKSCELGYEMARSANHADAIPVLNACIESNKVTSEKKRQGYIARAWVYKNLNDPKAAVADQESAFKLSPPSSYHELINYVVYLRAAGRVLDTLAPLKTVEAMDEAKGWTTMMTQYHIGWSFQELGRHEEAIAAFTKGIPEQNDFAYAYYRRGLSLEALGREEEARSDFEKVGVLIKTPNKGNTAEYELPPVLKKLKEYGIQ